MEAPATFVGAGREGRVTFLMAGAALEVAAFVNLTWTRGVTNVSGMVLAPSAIHALTVHDFQGQGASAWVWPAGVGAAVARTHTHSVSHGLAGWFAADGAVSTGRACHVSDPLATCSTDGPLYGGGQADWRFSVELEATIGLDQHILFLVELPSAFST